MRYHIPNMNNIKFMLHLKLQAENSPTQTFTAPVNHKTWNLGRRDLG